MHNKAMNTEPPTARIANGKSLAAARLSQALADTFETKREELHMAKTRSAAGVAVVDYNAAFNKTGKGFGQIEITLQRGKPLALKDISSHLEFIAILTLLQGEKTVFAWPGGVLSTKP